MFAIVAVAENGVIGNQGKMPWHLPLDFKWFKHKTMGGVLFMGRKTFEAIGRPLPGRTTCLITNRTDWPDLPAEVRVCNNWKEAIAPLKQEFASKPIAVCGGAQVYAQLLPHCDALYLTRVKQHVEGDTVFPPIPNTFQKRQIIFENTDFRLEKWADKQLEPTEDESWPFD